jgi:hypothetical protein
MVAEPAALQPRIAAGGTHPTTARAPQPAWLASLHVALLLRYVVRRCNRTRESKMAQRSKTQPSVAETPSRSRKVRAGITFWVEPLVRQQLRHLAVQSGSSVQALMEEALEDLFNKRGRPRVTVPGRAA